MEQARQSIFISHSHVDRQWLTRLQVFLRPFVRQQEVEVWDDSRIPAGENWKTEINAAISRARIAVLLVTPDFLASDFIMDEELPVVLSAAAAGQLTVVCVHVSTSPIAGSPLLAFQWANRQKPLDLLPKPHRNRALVEISYSIRNLISPPRTAIPPNDARPPASGTRQRASAPSSAPRQGLGQLFAVPLVPARFIPRGEQDIARAALLGTLARVVGISGKADIGVYGVGGIGKSVIAASLARDNQVRRAFPDGIFWLDVGERPDIIVLVTKLLRMIVPDVEEIYSLGEARKRLMRACDGKKCLIVLDDLWDVTDANWLDALPATCQILFTTRDSSVIATLDAQEVRVGVLSESESWVLVQLWAGQSIPVDSIAARDVVDWCGGLPLALAITGASIRDGVSWQELRTMSRSAVATYEGHPYGPVFVSLERSLRMLGDEERRRFKELVVFPEDDLIPDSAAQRLWRRSPDDTKQLLMKLRDKSLLSLYEGDELCFRVHDLTRDYLRAIVDDSAELHRRLLDGYGYSLTASHTFVDDEYLLKYLAYHLSEIGRTDLIARLLKHFTFVAAHVNMGLLPWLLADYEMADGEPERPDYQTFLNGVLAVLESRERADRNAWMHNPARSKSDK